jgi:hypothetical protein
MMVLTKSIDQLEKMDTQIMRQMEQQNLRN